MLNEYGRSCLSQTSSPFFMKDRDRDPHGPRGRTYMIYNLCPEVVDFQGRLEFADLQLIHGFAMDRRNTFHLAAEKIPARSSSRSPGKSDASSLKRILDWENKRMVCNGEAKEQRKRLKLTSSFDTAYWTARRDIAEKEI